MTRDTPAPGLVVYQPVRGFRYGSEAFWLVGFALERGVPRTAIDLGTGSGIMAFLLARHGVDVLGIDVRPEWTGAWQRSLAESTFAPRLETRDVLAGPLPHVDLILSNPPYFSADSPRSSDVFKAAARTESSATLGDFVRVALATADRACFVIPLDREAELLDAAGGATRRVHVGRKRALVELQPGASAVPEARRVEEGDDSCIDWYRLAR